MSTTRDNGKPNSARMHDARVTFLLLGIVGTCMHCGLGITWSREKTDEKMPAWGTFGHVVPECRGGGWQGNVGPECWTCQTDAKTLDKTGDALPGTVPAKWVPAKTGQQYPRTFLADAGHCPPARTLPGVKARRAARAARGLKW